LTPNPILKVLSTFQKFGVRALLIGGQACIIYGAAEFSRDSDFVILPDLANISRLKKALHSLKARNIYFPRLTRQSLEKGHACHFRCYDESVKNLRVDVIAKLRNCHSFEELWERKMTVKLPGNGRIEIIGLEDLVRSKKTQRDKDWLMLDRLIANDMLTTKYPRLEKVKWWLSQCRDAGQLIKLAAKYKKLATEIAVERPLVKAALRKDKRTLRQLIQREEMLEREKDKKYWQPLRKELELLRHKKSSVH